METQKTKNSVSVTAFGLLAEIMHCEKLELDDVSDTEELMSCLFDKYPILRDLSFSVSVNNEMVQKIVPLPDNAEVALLPPFSGG